MTSGGQALPGVQCAEFGRLLVGVLAEIVSDPGGAIDFAAVRRPAVTDLVAEVAMRRPAATAVAANPVKPTAAS